MITENFRFAVVRWSRPGIHWRRRGGHPSADARPHAAASLRVCELAIVSDPAKARHEKSRVCGIVWRTIYCVSLLVRLLFLCIINRALATAGAMGCRRVYRAAGLC